MADESAMNFVAVGGLFRHIYCFPQHFRQSGPKKEHRAGLMGLACGGAIILAKGIIRFLCTDSLEPDDLHKRRPIVARRSCDSALEQGHVTDPQGVLWSRRRNHRQSVGGEGIPGQNIKREEILTEDEGFCFEGDKR